MTKIRKISNRMIKILTKINEKWPNYAKLYIEECRHPRENPNENTDEKWQRYANFIKIDMHTFYYFGRYAVYNTPIYLIFNGKK